jgi:predicted tellurium resistance membrane protein TerC
MHVLRPTVRGATSSLQTLCSGKFAHDSKGLAPNRQKYMLIGPALSVALMGVAANYIARLLHDHRWIAYGGLLIILYVAIEMMYRGMDEVFSLVVPA